MRGLNFNLIDCRETAAFQGLDNDTLIGVNECVSLTKQFIEDLLPCLVHNFRRPGQRFADSFSGDGFL